MLDHDVLRRPYAPLPFWPIDGLYFSPTRHFERVLDVIGCHVNCPALRTNDHEYFSSAFSNARDDAGCQLPSSDIHLLAAAWDYWCDLDTSHDHTVDPDLVYPYPRIHPFPFSFSRPIRLRRCGRTVYVADIHLRWSEIQHGITDTTYVPSRYRPDGYPFDVSYFREACSLFDFRVPIPAFYPGVEPTFVHAETGLQVARSTYRDLYQAVMELHLHGVRVRDPVGYILRVHPDLFLHELQDTHGCWFLHGASAVAEVRSHVYTRLLPDRVASLGLDPSFVASVLVPDPLIYPYRVPLIFYRL